MNTCEPLLLDEKLDPLDLLPLELELPLLLLEALEVWVRIDGPRGVPWPTGR